MCRFGGFQFDVCEGAAEAYRQIGSTFNSLARRAMHGSKDKVSANTFAPGIAAILVAAAIAAAGEARSEPIEAMKVDLPAGSYTLDKAHSTLIFRVNHIGFSYYTVEFKTFDAKLELDPANPEAASLSAIIDPRSLDLPAPPKGFLDKLLGAKWLDAAKFPAITFRSTKIELIAPNQARIEGKLALHGVRRLVTLEATFNGGYRGHPLDPQARIGFSATGSLKRSDFGIAEGIPPPGTTMGVGDSVEFLIETEFNGPPLEAAAQPSAP
jgi:polyisoprenoid-binding protein YceI